MNVHRNDLDITRGAFLLSSLLGTGPLVSLVTFLSSQAIHLHTAYSSCVMVHLCTSGCDSFVSRTFREHAAVFYPTQLIDTVTDSPRDDNIVSFAVTSLYTVYFYRFPLFQVSR